jgi:hypothetical protein
MGYFMNEWFFITLARLRLTGGRAQVPVGWKEICAVAERSLDRDSTAFAMGPMMVLLGRYCT